MNVWDILILVLVALALVLAVLRRRKKRGSCCGDCSGCAACASGGKKGEAMLTKKLEGDWEPKGYIGPRAEIRGDRYTQLWRGTPVLETRFILRREGERLLLDLERDGLRYAGTEKDYARVKAVWLEAGALTVLEDFPITGESSDTLYPTKNSRYGNVTAVDDRVSPLLEGDWISPDTELRLRFREGRMFFGYGEESGDGTAFIALSPGDGRTGPVELRDRDPGRDGLGMFSRVTLEGSVIRAVIHVCDAPSQELLFRRAEE